MDEAKRIGECPYAPLLRTIMQRLLALLESDYAQSESVLHEAVAIQQCQPDSTFFSKALFRQMWEEGWTLRQWAVIDALIADDFVDHVSGRPATFIQEREGAKALMSGYFAAFPDLRFRVEQVVAEGEYVVGCWRAQGTHIGDFMGLYPTGKSMTVTGLSMNRIVNGKIAEAWTEFDLLGMLQQLGVVLAQG
jgi:steroid delta-isomerase-like uncharacterized protein